MIKADNLSVSFGEEAVIRNLSFSVGRGQKVALSGPSGCGKSTILNLLMGFVPSYTGEVWVCGSPLGERTVAAIRGQLSWLPQELTLGTDSVRELFYRPFTYRANRALLPGIGEVEQLFDDLRLSPALLDKSLTEISGGQKQRVALASVLLLKKPLLLMDEPTSALDAESREAIIAIIAKLTGVTVVAASHDAGWLDAMDSIINLKK